MESIKATDDVLNILNGSQEDALSHGQSFLNTARLFVYIFKYYEKRDDNTGILDGILKLFDKYSINFTMFKKSFKDLWPNGSIDPTSDDIEIKDDAKSVIAALSINGQSENREQDTRDLLAALFSDDKYDLFSCFNHINDIMKAEDKSSAFSFETRSFYNDVKEFLDSKSNWGWNIANLESPTMKKYTTNLTDMMSNDTTNTFVGMEDMMTALEIALAGRDVRSAILVGPAGTGKTSLVKELARRISKGKVPGFLKHTVIYELHLEAVQAGAGIVGEFESRMNNILTAFSKYKNVILFIDEMHNVTTAQGTFKVSDILKKYLSEGSLRVIGATTTAEYNSNIAEDKAIASRFNKVIVREPTRDECIAIMKGVNAIDRKYFDKNLDNAFIEKIYDLSNEYMMEQANPRKSIKMLEAGYAYARVCREKEKEITLDDTMKAVEIMAGIHIYPDRVNRTINDLKASLLGQDDVINSIGQYLKAVDLGIVNPEKPKAVLMFQGPTGTGKTEMAKIIANDFCGSDKNLILVPGNELQSETATNYLFGSDPGYIGYKPTSSFLQKVQENPNSVILFDEIEKAHPSVFKSLLTILDEGYAVNKGGDKISFRNTIIIFTTNLGYSSTSNSIRGLLSVTSSDDTSDAINKHFSPEFLGRVNGNFKFNRLTDDIVDELIERYRKFFVKTSGIDYKFSDKNIENIKKNADVTEYGARHLQSAVQREYTNLVISRLTRKTIVGINDL